MNLINFLLILAGIVIGIIAMYSFTQLKKRFLEFVQVIPQYLLVSFLIFIVSISAPVLNFLFGGDDKELFAGVINLYAGLFFVAFTGFFAFSQWKLSSFENLRKEALAGEPKGVLDNCVKLIEKTLESDKKEEFITRFNS